MNKILILSLFAGMLIFAGCPAETKNSIDNGSYNIPAWLPGTWQEIQTDKSGETYVLEQDNAQKGHLNVFRLDSTGKKIEHDQFSVILSDVGGEVFLNALDIDENSETTGWYLMKFQKVSKTEFTLKAIQENLIDFNAKQEDIKEFIQKNKNKTEIYDQLHLVHYKKLK